MYMVEEGARRGDKQLQRLARDSYVVHAASGHVHSLNEVIKNPAVAALVRDKKYAAETRLMDDFWARMQKADGRAWYGVQPVEKAVREGAVGPGGGVLHVNNSQFRSQDVATRRRYVALVDKVKADGGDARILSSDHESGQRLDGLGGIAALLSYPLFDLDEDEEEEAEGSDGVEAGDGDETTIVKKKKGGGRFVCVNQHKVHPSNPT